jgi:hypothetical protein
VLQSARLKPAGSPVPGARACRIRATALPSRSAVHASSPACTGVEQKTKSKRMLRRRIDKLVSALAGAEDVSELEGSKGNLLA